MAAGEDVAALLSARMYLYTLGQRVFGGEPTADLTDAVDPSLMASACEAAGIDPGLGLRVCESGNAALRDIEAATGVYMRLFVGPGKLAAPPWESVYRSRSKALFQTETLDVRNAYRVAGYLPEGYPHVADDHLALELGFLAALARQMVDRRASGEPYDDATASSRTFIDEHLGRWLSRYRDDLARGAAGAGAAGEWYMALVELIEALAAADLRRDRWI
ncbi:molecular chaperone TorD family protein [Adlercreutzia sp. R25]|uniref:Molecular chaperone TorD family protein n=1 Tax=Adlercreutzia shanghongiae TaxID=3111773 RepID=A0ABU6IYQ6_9ACTN|nr:MULTISPECIES: molecular chaperone TorD family protein [unclassified Adlercreutzia]MEC4271808.1 molecular chaperone TorD family protein [Adlercreutzia sp. R25]MEC4294815.1 molecular chaperone TorD family protein [Adlercreutzia sp. R22]